MNKTEYFKGWLKVMDDKELNTVLFTLSAIKSPYCPKPIDVFRVFNICPLDNLKCVFLLQDPYPQKDIATGIALGNNELVEEKLSPSLKIVKEAAINYEIPHKSVTFDNSLESWCKQGVLMLNSALTCRLNNPKSHIMIWRPFISKLLMNLSLYYPGIIYVLFGEQAQTFLPYINKTINHIFLEKHPSWYARTHTKLSSELFININNVLRRVNNDGIKWYEQED